VTSVPTFSDPGRIPTLDILRGCAVMGIMWMNITAFALPSQAYLNPAAAGAMTLADSLVWLAGLVLVDGKMRGLFSLLFGASMLLLIDKAEMAGGNGRRAQLVRAAWLFLFGLVHYLLLWWGDILMTYAIVGLAALLFTGRTPLALMKWALLAFLIHFLIVTGLMASLYAWSQAAARPSAAAGLVSGYHAFLSALGNPADPAIVQDIALHRSGFVTILAHQLAGYPGEWLRTFAFVCFDTLGFMLMGMAMLKGGFLTGRWEVEHYRRTARHCFLIGIPPMLALGLWVVLSDFAPLATFGVVLAWSFPFRIPLTVGWAALILWLAARYPGHALLVRIGTAGRMALSNYLGTSLVMTALFYGWGLGLFGHVGHAMLPAFVLGGWAGMLLWSPWWLNRFALGPFEWLWRSLARGNLQAIRRNS
jgi:uncharacterized protein